MVALNPLRIIFLNFAKNCIKWGSPSLAGYIVAMSTYCATKLTATYSEMIGQIVNTMSLGINQYTVLTMALQNLRHGKCWKLVRATLRCA